VRIFTALISQSQSALLHRSDTFHLLAEVSLIEAERLTDICRADVANEDHLLQETVYSE
jgi:hypothetical protein